MERRAVGAGEVTVMALDLTAFHWSTLTAGEQAIVAGLWVLVGMCVLGKCFGAGKESQ